MLLSTKKLALNAILLALGVVLLYIASLLPTMKIGLCAVAGLLVAVSVISSGIGVGFVVYASTTFLSFLFLPQMVLLYALMFGIYPLIKSLAERVKGRWVPWLIKLASCNIMLTAIFFLASGVLPFDIAPRLAIFYLGANVVFILYDIAFSGLITFFLHRFGKYLK